MNLTHLFILRPIMTTLVMIGILLAGVVGYLQLPVSDLPNVDFPTIVVSASLPGANPDTMAAAVATPLEQQFATIDGLDSMNSSSSLGSTQVTLQFNINRSLDSAAQDVQAAISTASRKLPPNMPSPPSLRKVNPGDVPVIYLAVSSSILPLAEVDDYAEKLLAQRLSMVSGVAQVSIYGSQKYAVRIQLNPLQLFARNLGIDEVTSAIQGGNANLPIGVLYGNQQNITVKANGQLTRAEEYADIIIAYRNGAPVYLKDVAHVKDSVENTRSASWFNKTRSVVLAVQRQPGTNTLKLIDAIKDILPTLKPLLPPSVKLSVIYDRSVTIRRSVEEVQFTLLLTIGLVVGVIFVFLRNLAATLIASLALPMAIIGTFFFMAWLGFSLDNISLMALTLCVGFVVDDAIVVLENIIRHMEMGKTALQASLEGSQEIGFTVLSMTLSLVAVFIPILLMGGVIGRLFNEFAVTITVSILVSGVVSLTLTPMLCSRFLKPSKTSGHGPASTPVPDSADSISGLSPSPNHKNVASRVFKGLLDGFEWALADTLALYQKTLDWAIHHKRSVLAGFFSMIVLTAWVFTLVPKGFIPTEDSGQLSGSTEGPQGISFQSMVRHQTALAEIAAANKNVASVMSSVDQSNQGRLLLILKPMGSRQGERTDKAEKVLQQLRARMSEVPGIKVFLQMPATIRLGGQNTKSQYQITLQSPDLDALYQAAGFMEAEMKKIPGLLDVTSDQQNRNPQAVITIDRAKAATLGINVTQVEEALSSAYGTRQISIFYTPSNDYQVILELDPEAQKTVGSLENLYIRATPPPNNNTASTENTNSPGTARNLVPLSTLTRIEQNVGPLTVSHLGQFPSVTLSYNLQPGISLGSVVPAIERLSQQLPASVRGSSQGTAQAFQSSLQGTAGLLILAILVIYLVLGILYESFIHPLTILSGLPSAGLGALVTLLLFHQELNLYGFLGLLMLVGIVKKNAIMMVDFALETERNHGKTATEAIYEACLVRFRPIMMTTLAALMGTLPIALAIGGGESRQSLGLVVFGGLLVSQLVTLYITPVLYIYMDRFTGKKGIINNPEPEVA